MAHRNLKVEDTALRDWLASDRGDAGELIVEASVPPRSVSVGVRAHGRVAATGITGDRPARQAVLDELGAYLADTLRTHPTLLRSAGAFAVKASPQEARRIASHRLVKTIRPNRRLHPTPHSAAHR
jgi:hypothetical protein